MELTAELMEQVIREVLRRMDTASTPACPAPQRPRALVLGDLPGAGAALFSRYTLESAEHYEGDICPYAWVLVTRLTGGGLADLALGRDDSPSLRAVADALLTGKPVWVLPDALCHRAHSKTASSAYYQMLEGYVRRLETFGVRVGPLSELEQSLQEPAAAARQTACPRQEASPAAPVGKKLITARDAQELVKGGGGSVCLAKGTLITPSARDVFSSARVQITFGKEA